MPAASDPERSLEATLELADWRRRVSDLYAEVRVLAATDVEAAIDLWRATRAAPVSRAPAVAGAGGSAGGVRGQPFSC